MKALDRLVYAARDAVGEAERVAVAATYELGIALQTIARLERQQEKDLAMIAEQRELIELLEKGTP